MFGFPALPGTLSHPMGEGMPLKHALSDLTGFAPVAGVS
jgi:hypothetical protein